MADEKRFRVVSALFEVFAERCFGSIREEYGANLAALAANGKFVFFEVYLTALEGRKFVHPQSRGKQQFQDGFVPEAGKLDFFLIRGGEELSEVVSFEESHLPGWGFGQLDFFRGQGFDIPFGQVFEKRP